MKNITSRCLFYLTALIVISIVGCANSVKFRFESTPTETMTDGPRTTIAGLSEKWTGYDVYYSGLRTTLAKGILFDPKNDNKVLKPEGDDWVKVDDEETFRDLIHWQATPLESEGRLFRIISPDDQFFGYIYLYKYFYTASAKMIDKDTIAVFPISVPTLITGISFN